VRFVHAVGLHCEYAVDAFRVENRAAEDADALVIDVFPVCEMLLHQGLPGGGRVLSKVGRGGMRRISQVYIAAWEAVDGAAGEDAGLAGAWEKGRGVSPSKSAAKRTRSGFMRGMYTQESPEEKDKCGERLGEQSFLLTYSYIGMYCFEHGKGSDNVGCVQCRG